MVYEFQLDCFQICFVEKALKAVRSELALTLPNMVNLLTLNLLNILFLMLLFLPFFHQMI